MILANTMTKLKELLPGSQLSEVMPCATEGKCNIHLRIDPTRASGVLDITKLAEALESSGQYQDVTSSLDLGLIRLKSGIKDITILASGRIVVKAADDKDDAAKVLADLAQIIVDSKSLL